MNQFGAYQFTGTASTTAGVDPAAEAVASATLAAGNVNAVFLYEVGVVPVNSTFPTSQPVPLLVSVAGSVTAQGNQVGSDVNASVSLNLPTPVGAAVESNDSNNQAPQSREFSVTSPLSIFPGGTVGLQLNARGVISGNAPNDGGDFQAVIDPIIVIDPTATFLFNGVSTHFADAYQLEFSDGVLPFQSGVVPEPSTLVLSGIGILLLGLAWMYRRGRRCGIAAG
jgi:hypothetical protein